MKPKHGNELESEWGHEAKGAWIQTKSRERVQSPRCLEMKLRVEGKFEADGAWI